MLLEIGISDLFIILPTNSLTHCQRDCDKFLLSVHSVNSKVVESNS